MFTPPLRTYDVDDSDEPLVVIRPRRGAKIADAEEFDRIVVSYLDRGRPFSIVHDARFSPMWRALDRQLMFEMMMREEARIRALVAAHAVLIPNAFARALVNGIFWGSPFRGRAKTFGDPFEAKGWAKGVWRHFVYGEAID
jgi:hypothetical protein